ncbi:573_t:CDS:2, partial [Funneliformis mosseae]
QQDDEQEGPLHIPTQEKRNELLNDHTPEEFLEVCEKNGQFRETAEYLRSRGKFKEAADMFIRSGFKDEDVIEALQCILHLSMVNVLKSTMTDTISPSLRVEGPYGRISVIQRLFRRKILVKFTNACNFSDTRG